MSGTRCALKRKRISAPGVIDFGRARRDKFSRGFLYWGCHIVQGESCVEMVQLREQRSATD